MAIVGPGWNIGKDNNVRIGTGEMRQLKTRRHLTDRTLHLECPNYKVTQDTAKAIAVMHLSDAIIGGCSYINVRALRCNFEFKVRELNSGIQSKWGNRTGIFQNPLEKIQAGCFYDETRKLWQVPTGFGGGARETLAFPMR